MCRLRRGNLEAVVPIAQGARYRPVLPEAASKAADSMETDEGNVSDDDDGWLTHRKQTNVKWIEAIPPGRFYLRVGMGRKLSGSHYTPRSLVRFLVRETIGPLVAERSPMHDPKPFEILQLKVIDPAMGSGQFLVEACRYLGAQLYEACCLCEELAAKAGARATNLHDAARDDALAEAQTWRKRVTDLPSCDGRLLACLREKRSDHSEARLLEKTAIAICRQLVVVHCLYGVDKNPLAVELAKLALWLETQPGESPLTFLHHRLVVGDSLTGPFSDMLTFRPSKPDEPIGDVASQGLADKLQQALQHAMLCESTTGRSLAPIRIAAAAWSGGVMLGPEKCDDAAYADLLKRISATGDLPERLDSERLQRMIARGLGLDTAPADRALLFEALSSGHCTPVLPFDLTFPEVFYPNGVRQDRKGFDAVLGNPPWDAIRPKRAEFFGGIDFEALAGHTRREREFAERRLLNDKKVKQRFEAYNDLIEGTKRAIDALYSFQKLNVGGDLAGRYLDLYRVFMERIAQITARDGMVGMIVPASFRANAGAVGVRQLYLQRNELRFCYTLRNTRLLFEISAGMQFCLIAAKMSGHGSGSFEVAFDVEDAAWLFSKHRTPAPIRYSLSFIEASGGPHLVITKLPTQFDVQLMARISEKSLPLASHTLFAGIRFQTNPAALNATKDSWRLEETALICNSDPRDPLILPELLKKGYVPLHEKGTFSRFNYRQQESPRYVVNLRTCNDRPDLLEQLHWFRLVGRSAIHATELEKNVFTLIPPGGLVSNSAMVEAAPGQRPNSTALIALSILNSHVFNYLAQQQVVLNLNLFILKNLRIPSELRAREFLGHAALRLVCTDANFLPLWHEQVGEFTRQNGSPVRQFVPLDEAMRHELQRAMNAVVALSYGLARSDYEHVLMQIQMRDGNAPLAAFTECSSDLPAFCEKYDPYGNVPLPESIAPGSASGKRGILNPARRILNNVLGACPAAGPAN
jgi:hypothetical protein